MAKKTDCPWLILDFVAIRRGSTVYIFCKVLNPASGSIEVDCSDEMTDQSQTVALPLTNCPKPAPEMFTFMGVTTCAVVSAELYDANGNLQYQICPFPVAEARSKEVEHKQPVATKAKK
jgi:hypothetical protein